VIALGPEDSKHRAVETWPGAARCAELFRKNRDTIDGIIITLPNFGDERAIAHTLRMSGLSVPILVQATPDRPGHMTFRDWRDRFCGKMSVCNNLKQYGFPYSLTRCTPKRPIRTSFVAI
jgi:L-fucose isomerase-like protein